MPKYCRAPNCSNTAGQLGSDNRPVSFYKFPLKDGPRLQAWLRCMGREHWVPSCHQHLCSEHFTPSCFQWRWGVRYLRPDAVPSIFSRVPPAKGGGLEFLPSTHGRDWERCWEHCSGGCGGCSGATNGTRLSSRLWNSWRCSCARRACRLGRTRASFACCLDLRNPKPSPSSVEGLT